MEHVKNRVSQGLFQPISPSPALLLLCSCSLVGAVGCEGNMDSLGIPTYAGWAPAAPLVVCNLGWNYWLAQA